MLLVSPPKKVERKRERECVRERGGEREERESGGGTFEVRVSTL